ncbi:hypothetical protein [Pseudomonas sp. MS19]|uniref:hypothetical protein n=1 Tax=Pseudomonas sp. MS19 TaxID=2579939 RepID=UPI001562BCD1|nr:hypothetical protein [Pseudomonas sp. MS19]NRH29225.1 hypothetical protein [Pseudomonas sp. MS19]
MKPGTIFFHKDFMFADGTTKNKYLVVLGNIDSGVVLAAKTTSKGHNFRNDFGCQSANRFPAFFLPAKSCCLPLSTWICLGDFYELEISKLNTGVVSGDVYQFGHLGDPLTRTVQFCAKGCDDISSHQEAMIDGSLAPK